MPGFISLLATNSLLFPMSHASVFPVPHIYISLRKCPCPQYVSFLSILDPNYHNTNICPAV